MGKFCLMVGWVGQNILRRAQVHCTVKKTKKQSVYIDRVDWSIFWFFVFLLFFFGTRSSVISSKTLVGSILLFTNLILDWWSVFPGVFFWNSLIRDPFQNSGLINFWSQISFYSLFIASRFNLNSIESLTRMTASQEKAANKTARVKGGQRVWGAISSTVGSRTCNIFDFIWTTRRVGGRRGHDRPSPCLAISTATLPVQQQPPSSR